MPADGLGIRLINHYLYNDKELFEDADLDWYDYGFRNYDPQIARFTQLDPLTWDYPELTNYQYASDEPIANVDMDGLEALPSIINPLTWFNLPQMLDPVVITAKLPAAAARTGETVGSIASGMASFVNLGVQQMGRDIDNTFVRQSPQTVERVGNTLQSAGHRNIQVPGQQVMEPISWLDRLSGQRSLSIDDGTGNMIDVEVDDEGRLTNKMGLTKFEVPFVPDRAPFSISNFFRGLFKSGNKVNELASFFQRGQTAKASELVGYAERQGWKAMQSEGGPLKYVDENGIIRMTIKKGSPRAVGSGFPHVELRNALGKRIDAFGKEVSRKSIGNHTKIIYDLK